MDLLEADVGGTCVFLREEFRYDINGSGLAGTNLNHSTTDRLKKSASAARAHLVLVFLADFTLHVASPVHRAGGAKPCFSPSHFPPLLSPGLDL